MTADTPPFEVAVIGGGPAGLMAAEVLSRDGADGNLRVTVYDRMPSLGRKFLMAGRGGLNLTHSEDLRAFLSRYGAREVVLTPTIEALPPDEVRAWCEGLGQETFIGTSGRVFPRAMKASPLLRAWLSRLDEQGVSFKVRYQWTGFDEAGSVVFATPQGTSTVRADATVLALGGGSWARLGSDGRWVDVLRAGGIDVEPLRPANCGVEVKWSDGFGSRFQGQPLKRIAVTCGVQHVRGEALVTAGGFEGGAIYAVSRALRGALDAEGAATLLIDLRPDTDLNGLVRQLEQPRAKQSMSTFLRKAAHLSPVGIGLLHEAAFAQPQPRRLGEMAASELAGLIKAVPVTVCGLSGIARAISTAGGVSFDEVGAGMMLQKRPGVFVAGEMLDWDAPTGGYLLQASFATGAAAGHGVLGWLNRAAPSA